MILAVFIPLFLCLNAALMLQEQKQYIKVGKIVRKKEALDKISQFYFEVFNAMDHSVALFENKSMIFANKCLERYLEEILGKEVMENLTKA